MVVLECNKMFDRGSFSFGGVFGCGIEICGI
jgi:hypothetical protein